MSAPKVIDLSHHNNVVSWQTVFDQGVIGVILKATEGGDYVDKTFRKRRQAAMAAGLLVSSYHFLRGSSIGKQVDNYLDVVQPAAGERVCLDHEAEATLDQLHEAVVAIQSRDPTLQITIYSGHTIKEQTAGLDQVDTRTSLWIAHYTTKAQPTWPQNVWPVWSLWQYTDAGSVDGIAGPVDCNRFNGDDEQLRAWWGPAVPVA